MLLIMARALLCTFLVLKLKIALLYFWCWVGELHQALKIISSAGQPIIVQTFEFAFNEMLCISLKYIWELWIDHKYYFIIIIICIYI